MNITPVSQSRSLVLGKTLLMWAGFLCCLAWGAAGAIFAYEQIRLDAMITGKTGFIARAEGIESQTFVMAQNAKTITKNIADATQNWNEEMKQESDFVSVTLPQVRDQVLRSTDDLHSISSHATTAIDTFNEQQKQFGPLLSSARGLTDQATQTLDTINTEAEHIGPPLDSARRALDSFNSLLASRDLLGALENANKMSGDWALISGDAYTRLHPILNPDPCRGRWCWAKTGYGRISALFPAMEAFYDAQRIWYGPQQTIRVITQKRNP